MIHVRNNPRVEIIKEFLIATDQELEAEFVSLIYWYRWQVELFFKWLKCILKYRYLLANSERGVAVQIYIEHDELMSVLDP